MSTETKKPTIILKPCPFCGAKAKRHRYTESPPELPKSWWSVGCGNRNCHGESNAFGDTRAEAEANWNKRRADHHLLPITGDEETPFLGVNGTFMLAVQSIEKLDGDPNFVMVRGLILEGMHFNDRGDYGPGETVTIGPITDTWRRLTHLSA